MKKFYLLLIAIFTISIANAQWQQTSFNPIQGVNTYNITCIATMGDTVFVGTNGAGVFLSPDNGNTWATANNGLPTNANIPTLVVSGTNIFASGYGGVYLSTNHGASWAPAYSGLYGVISYVYSLAICGTNIIAGTNNGIYSSSDNGSNWTEVYNGDGSNGVYSLAVSGTNIFAGSIWDGVTLSPDNGSNWTTVNNGIPFNTFSNNYYQINSLAAVGTNVFAGTNAGIYLSNNNGASWTAMNNGIIDLYSGIASLAVSGTNLFAGSSIGVYLSPNNDTNWTLVNNGLTDYNVTALAVNGTYLFAGTYGLWRCPISDFSMLCSAQFTLVPDTTIPHHYYAVNNATGVQPLQYVWSWGDGSANDSIAYPSHTYSDAGDYKICLTFTDPTGCTNSYCDSSYLQKSTNSIITVNVISQGTLGINKNELSNQIKIYPKPTKDNLTIETNANKEQRIEILNLIGQTVYTNIINKKATINTSAFARGVYILKLSSDKETVVRKFVKE